MNFYLFFNKLVFFIIIILCHHYHFLGLELDAGVLLLSSRWPNGSDAKDP